MIALKLYLSQSKYPLLLLHKLQHCSSLVVFWSPRPFVQRKRLTALRRRASNEDVKQILKMGYKFLRKGIPLVRCRLNWIGLRQALPHKTETKRKLRCYGCIGHNTGLKSKFIRNEHSNILVWSS